MSFIYKVTLPSNGPCTFANNGIELDRIISECEKAGLTITRIQVEVVKQSK